MPAMKLDTNFVYAQFKVGHKIISEKKQPNARIWDGMLIDFLDQRDWTEEHFVSEFTQKAFCFIKFNRILIPQLITGVHSINGKPNGDPANWSKYRARQIWMKFSELENNLGMPGLEADLRAKNKLVPIVDGTALDPTLFKASKDTDFTKLPPIPDLNAVSTGTFKYGSGGGDDYSTRSGAYADIANLTGPLTFQQNSAVTETATATITENLAGNTFKDESLSVHNGNPNLGHKTTYSTVNINQISIQCEGSGTFELDRLYNTRSASCNVADLIFTAITTEFTAKIHHLLADGANLGENAFWWGDSTPICHMWSSKFYDFKASATDIFDGNASGYNASTIVENIVIRTTNGNKSCIDARGSSCTFRNVAVIPSGTGLGFKDIASATGRNTASTDATNTDGSWSVGSGNVSSITAANEFESLTDTNAQFLDLKQDGTSTLDTAGVAPAITENTKGSRGNARPGTDAVTSIGSDEWGNYAGPYKFQSNSLGGMQNKIKIRM